MSIGLALLVSAEPARIQQFSRNLRQLSISADVCRDTTAAIGLLGRRKFEAVIVDLEMGASAGDVFDQVSRCASNRSALTFAIAADAASTTAFRDKVNFIFERPLSAQSIRNTLQQAYGPILRERRRYFRCPLSTAVLITRPSKTDLHCHSVNISEGGMALSTFVPLTPGDSVRVEFSLPDHKALFSAEGTICWCKTGHLGLRFVSLSQKQKAELQGWLSRKLEEMIPDFVAREFQKAEPFQRPPTSVRYHGRALLQNSTDHPAAIVSKPGESDLRLHTHGSKRCQLDVPLRVIVCNEDATKIYDGRGNEINDGGMTITVGVELKPGDTVAIEFTPPYGGVPIRVRGTVRNRTGYRYGVEFIIGSSEESSQLDRLRPILQTT